MIWCAPLIQKLTRQLKQSNSFQSQLNQSQTTRSASQTSIDQLKKPNNLSELIFSDIHDVEFSLEQFDGEEESSSPPSYLLTCEICYLYIKNVSTHRKLVKAVGGSFASGCLIDAKKYKILMKGELGEVENEKKIWRKFKHGLQDHVRCMLHEAALKYAKDNRKQQERSKKVTKTIVSVALTCSLSNVAARNFTSILSTLDSVGHDIGQIGHST